MKKMIVLTMALIPLLFVIFMSNGNSNNNENVRDIYLQNESYIDYYFDKYDLLSDNECIINIKESISLDSSVINNASHEDDIMIFDLLVDKRDYNMALKYDVLMNSNEYCDRISLELYEDKDDIYVISRYGYLALTEIEEMFFIERCAPLATLSSLIGDRMMTLEGGSSVLGKVIGGALIAGALAISSSYSGVNHYVSTVPNTSSTSSSNQNNIKSEILLNKTIKAGANDFLNSEANNYGWTDEELKDAFKKSAKVVAIVSGGTSLIALMDYLTKKKTICLGAYIDIYKEDSENVLIHKKYIDKALDYVGNYVFSMSYTEWKAFEKIHTKEGMWILNKFYLWFWISRDCDFLLLSNPNCFYIQGGNPHAFKIGGEEIGYSYSRELEYIYKKNYRWTCKLDPSILCNCEISATRGVLA